jgi:hypothetical protein
VLHLWAGLRAPFRPGDPSGEGDGKRPGDPVDPPHLAYPSRRTLAWRAASVIATPSTKGSRFALWKAGGANFCLFSGHADDHVARMS